MHSSHHGPIGAQAQIRPIFGVCLRRFSLPSALPAVRGKHIWLGSLSCSSPNNPTTRLVCSSSPCRRNPSSTDGVEIGTARSVRCGKDVKDERWSSETL